MNSLDTLKYSKRLEAAGVPPAQAEVHAIALAEVLEQVVTKNDLAAFKEWIQSYAQEQLQQQKIEILKWLFSMFIAQTGLLLAAMHYMMH